MKILFVADVPPDPNSGAAGTEYQTIQALRAMGHEVDAIWSDSLPHRIRHPNLHNLLELPAAFRDAIAKSCSRQDYHIIHANQPFAYLAAKDHLTTGRKGVFVSRSHGFEMAMHEQLSIWYNRMGIQERRFPKSILGRAVDYGTGRSCRLIAQYAEGFIVSSTVDQTFLIDRLHVPPNRVACIAQAPPVGFQAAPPTVFSESCNRLLVIGPASFSKGIHVISEAWNRLVVDYPSLSLTWVCHASEVDEARKIFSAIARERTTFLEPVSQEALIKIYDQHDIFIFPSLYEGFGKAPLEAMARGLCVVASDTGGMRDIITSGKDGVLIEVGNINQLISAVSSLHSDVAIARDIGALARETALKYSWNRVACETLEFYERLLRRKSTGSMD
ncbi:MAG: hypothetical protein COX55_11035 [Zetaproteobacteria bacterium CG23_combo_of_CG06-09_8_20_14_all_54_7]|nr:MAG: hypothetical protein COX55_11035 [Zetaproteobacteria bacterium CG23_combo_of_CG06-09_8_20_14_all_54_7]